MGTLIDGDYVSSYTGDEIDSLLGKTEWQSNPNLLDNWYFVGGGSQQGEGQFPINQRGQTSYSAVGYGIDRWISSGLVELTPQGISLSADAAFFQRLGETQDLINGQVVTASILFDDKFYSGTVTYQKLPSQNIVFVTNSSVSLLIGVDGDFYIINGSSAINACVAVKLELGDQQTLAHQENGVWVLNEIPNFPQELAKCQRYYQLYATQSLRPSNAADCRPVMRATPAQGTISIDGTTYYSNDANL